MRRENIGKGVGNWLLNAERPDRTARFAGLLYTFPWVLSLTAFMLRGNLVDLDDATRTAMNIMDNEAVFRLSIVLDLIVQVIFVALVLLLYWLLRPVGRNVAGLMAVLFLVSVPIAMYNTVHLLGALELLSGADYLSAIPGEQLHAQVLHDIVAYEQGIHIAYIFWGLWLFPLGYLAYTSGLFPRFVGAYLMISCFGYLIDFGSFAFLGEVQFSVNMLTGWAELVMCLWLLVKGVNVEKWKHLSTEVA